MPIVTQTRPVHELFLATYYHPNGSIISTNNGNMIGSQVTTSFRTSLPNDAVIPPRSEDTDSSAYYAKGLIPTDNGHEFSTQKVKYSSTAGFFTDTWPKGTYYAGFKYAKRPLTNEFFLLPGRTPPVLTTWNDARKLGNQAVKMSLPTNPSASVGQLLGELREGLPSMMGTSIVGAIGKMDRKTAFQSLGKEYLNANFGMIPMIKDLEKLFGAVISAPKTIRQYQRDSGKLVRRRMSFPVQTEIVESRSGSTYLRVINDADLISGSYYYDLTTTRQTKVWFSGAFKYHLPKGDDILSKAEYYASLAQKVLGLRLTPDVLWELSPWSWLVDWFADVGSNLSVGVAFANDNVVMEYGYLMRQQTAHTVIASTVIPGNTRKQIPAALREVRTVIRKERVKASPFGFGVPPSQFSTERWAILAALASTRVGGK